MTSVPVTSFDNPETFVAIVSYPTSERAGIGILFPKSDQQLEETMEKWLQRMDRIQFREKRDSWLRSDRLSAPLKSVSDPQQRRHRWRTAILRQNHCGSGKPIAMASPSYILRRR